MALLENSTRFCLFCYRSDSNAIINSLSESSNFYLFLKLVGRFNDQGDRDDGLVKLMESEQLNKLLISKIVGCCEGCAVTVNGFCDGYHKYKLMEMQLEWKMDRITSIIKLATRVPSRVAKVIKILQTEDGKVPTEPSKNGRIKVIRAFRHRFVKKCHRRLNKCRPRIFMSRHSRPTDNSTKSQDKLFKQLSNEHHIQSEEPVVQLTKETEEPIATEPEQTISIGKDAISPDQDAVPMDQSNASESEDRIDDLTTCNDYDDDPLNCDDFPEIEPQQQTDISPDENFTIPLAIQPKQEVSQIPEESSATQAASEQAIPEPPSSLIIQNVFSSLPPSPPPPEEKEEKLSNFSHPQCPICKKYFVSEARIMIHIKLSHKNAEISAGNPNQEGKSSPENQISPEAVAQQRYSLRQKRSAIKYSQDTVNDPNNYEDEYYEAGGSKSSSRSNTSDSEEDDNSIDTKPIIKIPPIKIEKDPENKVGYTNCKICNGKTTTKLLERHNKTWHDKTGVDDTQILKCSHPTCQAYFLTQKQLNFHLNGQHNKIIRCHMCQQTFKIRLFLKRHLRQVHGKTIKNPIKCLDERKFKSTNFNCNFCKFVTTSPTKLAIHETEHALPLPPDDPENFNLLCCPRCPYKYAKRMQRCYVVHHLRHHLSYLTGESSGACEMCSKGKWYVENTKMHFDNHHNTDLLDDPTKVFKCTECPAYYLKPFQLHRHKIRIHPLSKICEICEKSFKSRHSLNYHMRRFHKILEEDSGLPVPCDWPNCEKRFGTEAEVEFHKIYSHKRFPEETKCKEICEICGKGFRSVKLLKRHKLASHVEKEWICSECGKRFKRKKEFETHMDYHKGPESWKFECEKCGKKCFDKYKLKCHMNTHTKEKPWICQFCGERYAHRHNWRGHLKAKHAGEKGVDEIVNGKMVGRKGNYLSRKGVKKGDCVYGT